MHKAKVKGQNMVKALRNYLQVRIDHFAYTKINVRDGKINQFIPKVENEE